VDTGREKGEDAQNYEVDVIDFGLRLDDLDANHAIFVESKLSSRPITLRKYHDESLTNNGCFLPANTSLIWTIIITQLRCLRTSLDFIQAVNWLLCISPSSASTEKR
jgi:hypothetical protein